MSDTQDFMEEIQRDFLDEATFLIEQCEESYLKLEHPEHRTEELTKIFRLAHSMKGTGAAVGFTDLSSFAHIVEDLLSILRIHPDWLNTQLISLLLKAGDTIKGRIEMLKAKSPEPWNVEDLKAELKKTIASLNATASPKEGVSEAEPSVQTPNPAHASTTVSAPPPTPSPSQKEEDDFFAPLAEKARESVAEAAHAPSSPEAHQTPSVSQTEHSPSPSNNSPAPGPSNHLNTVSASKRQSATVKVDTDRIENVLNIVGELVVIKSQLLNEAAAYGSNLRLNGIVSLLDKTVRELQDKALSIRMTPLKPLFLKTQRLVRDLSLELNKPVDLVTSGEETEIDRTMVELLADPLLHLMRNSLDHGIEKPEVRSAKGKLAKGTIALIASQQGGRVILKVKDDGGGINREKVLNKAIEKNLIPPGQDPRHLTDAEVFNFIFAPGFSTAEKVTSVSGRGVGMDVVKTNIEKMKGTIEIESSPASGTCFTISIPLTTSITDGLLVVVNKLTYVLPMDGIRELVEIDRSSITRMSSGQEVLHVRGRFLPIIPLRTILMTSGSGFAHATQSQSNSDQPDREMVVVVDISGRHLALKLDGVLGQTQVVLKPMGSEFKDTQGITGAAILGDGKVALVLDLDGIAKNFARGSYESQEPPQPLLKAA